MRAAGRAGDPNFNTLEASALLDTALVPYHDLFSGDRHYTRIITNMGEGEDKVTMSRIISEEVDRTLSRWKNFDFQMQQMQRDFVAFGRGYLAWDNEASWRFRKVAQHRVMVPDSSEIDLGSVRGPTRHPPQVAGLGPLEHGPRQGPCPRGGLERQRGDESHRTRYSH
jgi:hypothetical protein